MGELEGVIKYQLDFVESEQLSENLKNLNCLRSILYGLGLIGQDNLRYQGFGFGNLSQRCDADQSKFIITGSQTGHFPELLQNQYVCVEHCDIALNHVIARGPVRPSSEALTHSMFYRLDASVECVIHVHSSELWHFGLDNNYPFTEESVEYGTQGMAIEIARLYQLGSLQRAKTLIMAGHEDGVICFGDSISQAGRGIVDLWVHACNSLFKCQV